MSDKVPCGYKNEKKNREKRKDKQAKIHVESNYFPRIKLHLISCQGIEFFLCM